MAKFTDGKQYVDLYMGYWQEDSNSYTEDYSYDFFEVGGLKRDENGFHIVDDADHLIEMMEDWCEGRGDYYYDAEEDLNFDNRTIAINRNKEELFQ